MFQRFDKLMTRGSCPARLTALRAETLAALVVVLWSGWRLPLAVASGLSESVHTCAQEPDDAKRLVCYDNAAGRAQPRAAATRHPASKADQASAASAPGADRPQVLRSPCGGAPAWTYGLTRGGVGGGQLMDAAAGGR